MTQHPGPTVARGRANVRIAVAIVALLFSGCATRHTTTVEKLMPLQTSSSFDPLFYDGSDQHYHYFSRLNLKYWQKYRVPRASISLGFEFRAASKKSRVMWPGTLEDAVRGVHVEFAPGEQVTR